MPFSHHSHSGQFCPGHAKNTLQEMVQRAIAKGMRVYALTEHMPRHEIDFYPEELELHSGGEDLHRLMDEFYVEACRLKTKYASQIQLLVGFESEWIRPESLQLVRDLQEKYAWDIFVGSVHHVHSYPIDFDSSSYELARAAAGDSERLFEDYFDSQYDMLQTLKPPVVGHFDLIRLFSENCNQSFRCFSGVWTKIERNLRFIAGYGGILELNSSALRKGMSDPYPAKDICESFLSMGGRFCLSDDAHSVEQVGLSYDAVLAAAKEAGIRNLYYYTSSAEGIVSLESIAISDVIVAVHGNTRC